MAITLYTHFVNDIALPNTTEQGTSTIEESLEAMVDKYEKVYLREILGYAEYKNVIDNVADVSGIYYDFINGAEYTDINGDLQYWDGFKTIGFNPIACYVYYQVMKNNETSTTGTGEYKPLPENQSDASPIRKMVDAWNFMVECNYKLHAYLYANSDDFPDYIGLTYPPAYRSYDIASDNQYLFCEQNIFNL